MLQKYLDDVLSRLGLVCRYSISLTALAVLLLLACCLHFELYIRDSRYPPGPRPLPFVGNLHAIPRECSWRKYREWNEKYGPIITVYIGYRPMIVVGSHECARDLFDRRGSVYNSRPEYFPEGIGSDLHTVGLPYGGHWRSHRRLLHTVLNKSQCEQYTATQDIESRVLLSRLLQSNDFSGHFHRFAGSLTYSLAYGTQVLKEADYAQIREIEDIMRLILDRVILPTVPFPFLALLPHRFAPWKRMATRLYCEQRQIFVNNFRQGQSRATRSWTYAVSEAGRQQRQLSESGLDDRIGETELAYLVGASYEAGSDTTAFILEMLVMSVVLHPHLAERVRSELDGAVGMRMPTFEDVADLPYLKAYTMELLRWRPVVPGGIQHAASKDDYYRGYYIPRGATVIPNHWSMESDPSIFGDPEDFNPERWIQNPLLPSSAFGVGRRECPGRHLAMNSLLIVISRLLWAFYIVPQRGRLPNPNDLTNGISSRPKPFDVIFQPRSLQHRHAILATEASTV